MKRKVALFCLLMAAVLLLTSCGGGGGSIIGTWKISDVKAPSGSDLTGLEAAKTAEFKIDKENITLSIPGIDQTQSIPYTYKDGKLTITMYGQSITYNLKINGGTGTLSMEGQEGSITFKKK